MSHKVRLELLLDVIIPDDSEVRGEMATQARRLEDNVNWLTETGATPADEVTFAEFCRLMEGFVTLKRRAIASHKRKPGTEPGGSDEVADGI